MAAVLAVFKAGGVYLPIEPHFPADRIATTLAARRLPAGADRAGQHHHPRPGPRRRCRRSQRLLVDDGLRRGPRRRRPRHRRGAPTSSPTSTSPPAPPASPRARCASTPGMLNHLYAKIDDLRHRRGRRWSPRPRRSASTSRCGSWSSALLVGGRTLLVEQEAILDVERFVDTIVDGRVAVLQVVPSYLEVVLSYLEQHPRDAARPAVRVGHRRGAEEGARAALVRRPARASRWSTPTG